MIACKTNNCLEDLRIEALNNLDKVYCQGYMDGIGFAIKQLGITNLWCKYNYGATSETDHYCRMEADGTYLTYNEAKNVPYLRLPSKCDFEELFSNHRIEGKFNVSHKSVGLPFNVRMKAYSYADNREISFYNGFFYDNNDVLHSELDDKYLGCVRVWLKEEISEIEALTALVFIHRINYKHGGEFTVGCTSPIYESLPKSYKVKAHFILQ